MNSGPGKPGAGGGGGGGKLDPSPVLRLKRDVKCILESAEKGDGFDQVGVLPRCCGHRGLSYEQSAPNGRKDLQLEE